MNTKQKLANRIRRLERRVTSQAKPGKREIDKLVSLYAAMKDAADSGAAFSIQQKTHEKFMQYLTRFSSK